MPTTPQTSCEPSDAGTGTGTGIGTFIWAFSAYRPEGLQAQANFAHNDYLHMASEMGVASLVFLRDGRFVTIVSGMLDWDDYLRAVNAALAMPATRVPGIGIPVVSAHASASGCH